MKKIVIAVVLVVILIGISYYQVLRQDSREKVIYDEGYQSGQQELSELREDIDSLSQAVEGQKVNYEEYLGETTRIYTLKMDSLQSLVNSQNSEIDKLKTKSTPISKPKKTTKNAEILKYYKKQYSELPGDLSNYERRVALSEIRENTARKFSISLNQLSKVRKDNNLDY